MGRGGCQRMFSLVIVYGPDTGKEFLLDRDSVVLGRNPDAEIFLPDLHISRTHARIWQRDGSYFIENLGSRNPIILNGQPVSQAALTEGDAIQVGPYLIMVRRELPSLKWLSTSRCPKTSSSGSASPSTPTASISKGRP